MNGRILIRGGLALISVLTCALEGVPLNKPDEPTSAMEILRRVSETYRNLKSYELYGTVSAQVEGVPYTYFSTVVVSRATSSANSQKGQVPIHGPLVSSRSGAWLNRSGGEVKGPGMMQAMLPLNFEQIDAHVRTAKLLPGETILVGGEDVACDVIEIEYQPGLSSRDVLPEPQQVWIDKTRNVVVRYRLSAASYLLEKDKRKLVPSRYTVSFNTLRLDEPPSASPVGSPRSQLRERAALRSGEAPDFTLMDLNQQRVHLAELRGRIVVLYFWDLEYDPCKEAQPILEKLRAKYEKKRVEFWGIADAPPMDVLARFQAGGCALPTLVDLNHEVTRKYQIQMTPTVIIVDRRGRIAGYTQGIQSLGEINEELQGMEAR